MKKALLLVFLLALLALAAALAWLRYGSGGYIAGKIVEYSRQYTGSAIEMQHEPLVRLFPPGLFLEGIAWESADKKSRFDARSLSIAPNAQALLSGRISLEEVILEGPVLKMDLRSSPDKPTQKSEKEAKNNRGEAARGLPFEIGRFIVQKGRLDLLAPASQIRLDELNLSAMNLRGRQDARLSGDFVLEVSRTEAGRELEDFAGNLAFRATARYYEPNLTVRQAAITYTATRGALLEWLSPLRLALDGALNLDSQELNVTQAALSAAQGRFSFHGNVNLPQKSAVGQCTLALDMPKILGQTVPAAVEDENQIVIDSPAQFSESALSLNEIAIKSRLSEGSGKLLFHFPDENNAASIEGALSFRHLALLFGKTEKRGGQPVKTKMDSSAGAPPFGLFPDIDLRLEADDFQYASFRAKKLRATVQGAAGDYRLRNGAMQWADGDIEATASCNFADNLYSVQAKGSRINAGLALRESGFKGFDGGLADFQANLSTSGLDLESLRSTLAGSASFTARDVKINLLRRLAEFLPSGARQALPDAVRLFMADMRANNGELLIEPVKLEAKSLEASGSAGYMPASGKIDGKLQLKFGSISLPLLFSGSVDDISWKLGGEGFLRRLLRDLP